MPDGWSLRPLASEVVDLDGGVSVNAEDRPHGLDEIGVLKTSALSGGTFHPSENKTVLSTERTRVRVSVRAESVLVSRMNTPELVGEAAFVPSDYPDLYLPDRIWQLRMRDPEACVVRWLGHYLQSSLARVHISQSASGTSGSMKNLPKKRFLAMPVNWPPVPEQRLIAEILDTIDDAIRKTEQIIAKLKQVKQGLLHDLLTRGVDDNGELRDPERHPEQFKDSLLGRIPRGWEAPRLEQHLEGPPQNGHSPTAVEQWTGRLMLGLGCLSGEGFVPQQLKNAPQHDPRLDAAVLRDGDLLLSRANTRELVGLAGIYCDVGVPCTYPDLMMRLTPRARSASSAFLELVLRSPPLRKQIQAAAVGTSASMVKISGSIVKRLVVALPPLVEQSRILVCANAGKMRANAEEVRLEKLRFLKAGLIEDLLTGRVRVTTLLQGVAE